MTSTDLTGWCAIGLGSAFSIALLLHDIRAMLATEPYEGMRRYGPELHVFGGLVSGIGAGLLAGPWVGLGVGLGQVAVAFAVFLIGRRWA